MNHDCAPDRRRSRVIAGATIAAPIASRQLRKPTRHQRPTANRRVRISAEPSTPNRICHAHTAGPGYEVTFTFPVDYPDQQALTAYLTQRREDFTGYRR